VIVGIAEGIGEGVMVGGSVAVGGWVGMMVAGAQLPTNTAMMKNLMMHLVMISFFCIYSIAFPSITL
jgi:hypothetical protein